MARQEKSKDNQGHVLNLGNIIKSQNSPSYMIKDKKSPRAISQDANADLQLIHSEECSENKRIASQDNFSVVHIQQNSNERSVQVRRSES